VSTSISPGSAAIASISKRDEFSMVTRSASDAGLQPPATPVYGDFPHRPSKPPVL